VNTLAALSVSMGLTFSLVSQQAGARFEPTVGQPGKDVVWVPTSPALVEKMLDLAKVTPQDVVMDLGSGDGRNIIAAAKRGARGVGFEFNPDMVELSRRLAQEAGVADKATFVQGDMYEADISKASVMALFLLPTNLEKLKDKLFNLRPGSRIVMNTFTVEGWEPDVTERLETNCESWCTAALYIVPAKVEGTWQIQSSGAGGTTTLTLKQQYQKLSGTWTTGTRSTEISDAKMRGDEITFKVGSQTYTGRVTPLADQIDGSTVTPWRAIRDRSK
jgi:precorrin-6B methylase 2